jgi:hypothetical protein
MEPYFAKASSYAEATTEPFAFAELPHEMQYYVIDLLAKTSTATTVQEAGKMINALAQTNKELHTLINNPQFCLKIIKNLAQQFKCSDQDAAASLQTQEAKKRLNVQLQFLELFKKKKSSIIHTEFGPLYAMYKGYVDLNFTYNFEASTPDKPNQIITVPLLFIATYYDIYHGDDGFRTYCLLKTKTIDANIPNSLGITPLMLAAQHNDPEIIKLLCNYPEINVNYQHGNNLTALLFALVAPIQAEDEEEEEAYIEDKIECIQILLDANADPTLSADTVTPLWAAQETGNQDIIDLIQHAINENLNKSTKK